MTSYKTVSILLAYLDHFHPTLEKSHSLLLTSEVGAGLRHSGQRGEEIHGSAEGVFREGYCAS